MATVRTERATASMTSTAAATNTHNVNTNNLSNDNRVGCGHANTSPRGMLFATLILGPLA
eukprot:11191829-Lingulodinium_polyedra.AAC.1